MELTPWFDPDIRPARPGMYRAQDTTMGCDCCWIDLYWTGSEWRSDHNSPGYWRTHFSLSHLRRWRGAANPIPDPKVSE